MKKHRHLLSALILTIVLTFAFSLAASAVETGISLSAITMYKGSTITLTVKAGSGKVIWLSSDKKIASVSQKGEVTAQKTGKAVIAAAVGKKRYICLVTVENPTIRLNKKKAALNLAGTASLRLKATVKGPLSTVVWESSNPSVAKVSRKGLVTAKTGGTAVISATANGVKATCRITVQGQTIKQTALEKYQTVLKMNDSYERFLVKNLMGDSTPELFVCGSSEGGFIRLLQYNSKAKKAKILASSSQELYINKERELIISHETNGGDIYMLYNLDGTDFASYSHYPDGSYYKNEELILSERQFNSAIEKYLFGAQKYTSKKARYANTAQNRLLYVK